MDLKNKNCLVTGGAGFIGSHLVDKLIERGAKVKVFDNLSNGKLENIRHHRRNSRFKFTKGSVNKQADVADCLKDTDLVFHLACLGVRHSIKKPLENHKVNAEGTLIVLEAAKKQAIEKFIYCSSSEVYGTAQYVPMPEEHLTRPKTVYGAGKLAGEAYARAYHDTYNMNVTIIRPFNTFGPRSHYEGDAGEFIPKAIIRALNKKNIVIFGDGRQTRDFTYVEDTAKGLISAAICDSTCGGTYNIGSNIEISIMDIAKKIINKINNRISVRNIENRPGDVLRLYAKTDKFQHLTGWRPEIEFGDGLDFTIHWFKEYKANYLEYLKKDVEKNWQ
ncbi:MAG: GDP-mannose 4,6-dehydratase [bacterium]